jgi:hypothetical protein
MQKQAGFSLHRRSRRERHRRKGLVRRDPSEYEFAVGLPAD